MSDEIIREEAKKALRERGLKFVIGWSAEGAPLFAETEEDADKLSFNKLSANNLVTYLTQEIRSQRGKERDGRDKIVKPVGVVVKGCDSKALRLLLNENILSRKEVFIIGAPCTGVVDKRSGNVLYEKCVKCATRNPVVYDVLASEKVQEDARDYSEVEAIEKMSTEGTMELWEDILSDLHQMYACKRSCPVCYCDECQLDHHRNCCEARYTAKTKRTSRMGGEVCERLGESDVPPRSIAPPRRQVRGLRRVREDVPAEASSQAAHREDQQGRQRDIQL